MLKAETKKFKAHYPLVVVFLAFLLGANAQIQRYSFHPLTPAEGLSQASNDFIYHDSQGFIWLSSIDGLNRFDGKSVKIYKPILGDSTSLIDNNITSNFFEDAENNLWFSTYKGLHCYVRATDNFRRYQLVDKQGKKLQKNYHAFHLDNNNQLWVRVGIKEGNNTSGYLHLFNTITQKDSIVCPIDGHRNSVVLDEKSEVQEVVSYLFPTHNGIEVIAMQAPFETKSFFEGINPAFPSSRIKHILVDTPRAWYLSGDKGLIRFNPLSHKYQIWDTYQATQIGEVTSTENVEENKLWVATGKASVLVYDKKQAAFVAKIPHEVGKETGLQLNRVNKLYKDKQDNIWMSSTIAGVNYTNLNKCKFERPNNFIDHHINTIYETKKGEVFCSYASKIAYYPTPDTALIELSVPQGIMLFFEDNKGNLFGVTSNALLAWNPTQLQFEHQRQLPNFVFDVYVTKSGNILFLTYGGIFEYKQNEEAGIFIPFKSLGKHQKAVATTLHEDAKERLYLAIEYTQLLILEKQGGTYQIQKEIDGIGEAKGFLEQDSLLFVATTTGLLRIETSNLDHRLLTIEDGIPNETYYSVIADDQGDFWLGSNNGIIQYKGAKKEYHRFSVTDGLQGNEFNSKAFLKTSIGEVWMGGTKGLNRFYPKEIQMQSYLPQIQFTQLLVNDEPYETENAINVNTLKSLDLEYENNTLSFHFVALEYSDPEKNKFKYRLKNHETDWVDAGNSGFARYSSLPSGDYTFQVKGSNSDKVWNESPKEIAIHIQTPWWMTWWFRFAILLGFGAIIYGVFRYQLAQALKMERMRVKISSDLHDDVGGLLSGLAMQSELLEMTASEDRKPKLQRISDLSRSAMSRMRDTVWAIDARKDKLENLLDRIREHAAESLTIKDIRFDLQVEDLALDRNISSHIRQNLYLICKEAITNASKHSNGNTMTIEFSKEGRSGMLLRIHDNGQVLQKSYKTTGLGMSNMRMRAEQIKASFEVDTSEGFLIWVKVP